MGTIGFIDDYIKIFKKDKEGLKGIFKVVGQVGLGLIVGSVLYFHPGVTIRTDIKKADIRLNQTESMIKAAPVYEKSTATTIPFVKIMSLITHKYFPFWEVIMKNGHGSFLFQL